MFSKFNYSPSDCFYNSTLNHCLTKGNEVFAKHEKEVQKCLSEYITEDGIINGTALKEHRFSITQKDIFISHSHRDINKVKAFAGWLHEYFGPEAFIDSCSWGYCDDLLNKKLIKNIVTILKQTHITMSCATIQQATYIGCFPPHLQNDRY